MNKRNLILLLPLLLAIFFFDILFLDKTFSASTFLAGVTSEGPYGFSGHRPAMPFTFDTGGNAWVNEPSPYIIRRILNQGSSPLWNPYEGLGMPLIANLNNEILNPLKLFLNLSPNSFLQDIFFLLRLLVMGSFTYLFLRERKHSSGAALLGALSFMLSGYSVWWINLHPLSTVMYLPAVFYFYERWCNKKGLESPFFMSLSLCFAFVSGKIPDVIMGLALLFLYALWKGTVTPPPALHCKPRGEAVVFAMFREAGKVIFIVVSAILMSAVALFPFVELYENASPLARAIRTGAASHVLPPITLVTLFQPLFLGLDNYFYGSWLSWNPNIMMPHASLVLLMLVIYAALNRKTLLETLPFVLFTMIVFSIAYGVFPTSFISGIPLFRSIEFLKYNAMCYFSIGVIAASAFDHLLSSEGNKKKLILSAAAMSLMLLLYLFSFYRLSPPGMHDYLIRVFAVSLSGLVMLTLVFHFSKKKRIFAMLVVALVILELFLYMPKDHPDRSEPYREPPYLSILKSEKTLRFIGDGGSVPPLVSNAVGLYDIRGISVLFPRDYYIFFENLLSFSVPQTNNPNPLFSATSPFLDLIGGNYILSREPLDHWRLEDVIRSHITSLRWIRFFDAMIVHTVKGGGTYGYFAYGGEKRFSFSFPMKFAYEARLRVSEPFIFAGFALDGIPKGTIAHISITVENRTRELTIREGSWEDHWFNVSEDMGKVITITVEGKGSGDGRIMLGNFGLSPGPEKEGTIYEKLLALHRNELPFIKHRGEYGGIHIYENTNVMDRAFVLHEIRSAGSLNDVMRELQGGNNFRKIGLVTENITLPLIPSPQGRGPQKTPSPPQGKGEGDTVVIKKYLSDEVAVEVESKGGLLVLSDLYYPGWKVQVNGREEKVLKAFGILRGVVIGEGRSEVHFRYRPMVLYAGAFISALTFIIWIIFLLISRVRKI